MRTTLRPGTKAFFLGLLTLGLAAGSAGAGVPGSFVPAVPSAVTITISKTLMTFDAPLGGPNPPPQTLKLTNTGASSLLWKTTVTYGAGQPTGWLSLSPAKGHRSAGQSKTVSVSVAMTSLPVGTYTATVVFSQKTDASNAAPPLTVTLHVLGAPFIDLEPSTGLTFNAPAGSGQQPTQTLTLTNLGGQTLTWVATFSPTSAWITSVTPASGTLTKGASITLTVTVNATVAGTPLAAGTYPGSVTVTSPPGSPPVASNSPVSVPITLNVSSLPFLDVSTTELDFAAPVTAPSPAPQTVTIRNSGGSPLDWNVSILNGSTWLTVSPLSGTGVLPGVTLDPAFTVSVNPSGLTADVTYTDFLVIGGNASNAGLQITVTFTISSTPQIDVEPPTLTFNAPLGGPDPAIQTVSVANQGSGILSWVATIPGSPAPAWLSLNVKTDETTLGQPGVPPGGADQVQVIVSVASISTPGTYTATINFDDTQGTVVSVFVTLNVSAVPVIELSPTSLVFNVAAGGLAPSSQTVTLGNSGGGATPLSWTGASDSAWLSVGPGTGSLAAGESTPLTITVDPSTLTAGSVVGQITITGTAGASGVPNSPQILSVTVNAVASPVILLSPSSLTFDVAPSGAAVQQTVILQNTGGGPADLTFQTSAGVTWLGVTPAGGSLAAGQSTVLTITATPDPSQGVGTYTGLITVGNSNATNDPQSVFVTMNVVDVPKLDLSPTNLVFNLSVGGAIANQTVTLSNIGGGPTALSFSIVDPSVATPWLGASPANGTVDHGLNTPLTITANPGSLGAGTYTGTVEVDSSNANNAPQYISVTMNLTTQPRIGLSPTSLTFTTGAGTNPGNQTVNVTNTGGSTLNWSAAASVNTPAAGTWLGFAGGGTPSGGLAGGTSGSFDVQITVGTLTAGTYSGQITITAGAPGATNTPQTIAVTLNVLSGPAIGVSPASLSFTTPVGVSPAAQPLTVSSTGGSSLNWSASAIVTTPSGGTWLSIPPATGGLGLAAGTSAAPFNVSVDVSLLAPGTYNGTIRITGDPGTVNTPVDVPVTLKVESQPVIGLSPAAIVFTVTLGAGNPTDQTITVTNLGDLTLNWSAASAVTTPAGGAWLGLSGTTGGALTGGVSAPPFNVTVDVTSLAAGSYAGTVTVSDPSATNNPQTVGVTLIINTPAGTVKIPKAGYCGSVGFDVAFPLLLLWAFRKWRGGRRLAGTALSAVLVLAFSLTGGAPARADEASELPRTLAQEEKAPEHPTQMPAPTQGEQSGEELFDFGDGALNLHVGLLDFSSDFKAKSEVCGGIGLRVPSPFLSTIFGPERDRIGFLLDVTGSSVTRDISGIENKSGTLVFAAAGLYGTFLRTESFEAQAEVAAQYGYFGGVTKLTNGVAAVLGLRGVLELAKGFWATLEPEVAFGSGGSRLIFVNAGVDIGF